MKKIKKDELFRNLGGFLKSKGIELNEGSYTARIQRGCNLLSDAINGTQTTVSKTRDQVDHALDQLRQTIHEKTAPTPPPPAKGKTSKAPNAKSPAATDGKKSKPKS